MIYSKIAKTLLKHFPQSQTQRLSVPATHRGFPLHITTVPTYRSRVGVEGLSFWPWRVAEPKTIFCYCSILYTISLKFIHGYNVLWSNLSPSSSLTPFPHPLPLFSPNFMYCFQNSLSPLNVASIFHGYRVVQWNMGSLSVAASEANWFSHFSAAIACHSSQLGWDFVSQFSIHAGMLSGLIMYRVCA